MPSLHSAPIITRKFSGRLEKKNRSKFMARHFFDFRPIGLLPGFEHAAYGSGNPTDSRAEKVMPEVQCWHPSQPQFMHRHIDRNGPAYG